MKTSNLDASDMLSKLIGKAVRKCEKVQEKKESPSSRRGGKNGAIGSRGLSTVGVAIKKTPDSRCLDELEKVFINPELVTHFYNFIDHCRESGIDLNDAQVVLNFSKRDGTAGPTMEVRKSGHVRKLFQLERMRLLEEEESEEEENSDQDSEELEQVSSE